MYYIGMEFCVGNYLGGYWNFFGVDVKFSFVLGIGKLKKNFMFV